MCTGVFPTWFVHICGSHKYSPSRMAQCALEVGGGAALSTRTQLRRDVVLPTLCKTWRVLTRNACCNDVAVGLGPDKVKNLDVCVRVRLFTVPAMPRHSDPHPRSGGKPRPAPNAPEEEQRTDCHIESAQHVDIGRR